MTMTTPAVPAGATNVSVGISLRDVGSVTGDDYYLGDADGGGDTTDPTVALTAPAAGAGLSGTATLTATASDNAGVARVEFLVDDQIVGSDADGAVRVRAEHHDAGRRAARDPGARGQHRQQRHDLRGRGDRRGQRPAAARAEPAPEPVPRGRRGPGGRRPRLLAARRLRQQRVLLGPGGRRPHRLLGGAQHDHRLHRRRPAADLQAGHRRVRPGGRSRPPLPGARLLHVHRPCAPRRVLPLERRRVDVLHPGRRGPGLRRLRARPDDDPARPGRGDPPQHRHLAAGGRLGDRRRLPPLRRGRGRRDRAPRHAALTFRRNRSRDPHRPPDAAGSTPWHDGGPPSPSDCWRWRSSCS